MHGQVGVSLLFISTCFCGVICVFGGVVFLFFFTVRRWNILSFFSPFSLELLRAFLCVEGLVRSGLV